MTRTPNKTPVPDVRRAILVNAISGEPTWHTYVGTFQGIHADYSYIHPSTGEPAVLKGGTVWEHLYVSEEEPKVQRVWGYADARREED